MYKAIFDSKLIVWKVINTSTKAIQSAWGDDKRTALQVAADLNRRLHVRS